MPRIGKQPVAIPSGVTLTIDGNHVHVKGPKGELDRTFHHRVQMEQKDDAVTVTVRKAEEKRSRELWGTARALLANMVQGVTQGFEKKLEVNGVGYKVALSGNKLVLNVGYSHPVEYSVPDGITVTVDKNVITVQGIDKQKVGQIASEIRNVRKPEPYKGKGIKYIDETIRRKAGKVVKAAGAS